MRHELLIAAALKVLTEHISELDAATREVVMEQMRAGDRLSVPVATSDGGEAEVATAWVSKGAITATVINRQKFLAWVREHVPDEIEHVERVRPAFEKTMLEHCKKQGAPVSEAGEVIPGIDVGTGAPRLNVRTVEEARELIGAAVRRGELPELFDLVTPQITEE